MSFEPVISLNGLSKCYHIYEKPRDRLLQMLSRGRRQYFREFWALKDVSFDIHKGDCLGIVGRNGAGKSTLLQLICGTLAQTSGDLSVRGRVAALLELGAGFNPEFTGRENVHLSATVLGLSKDEINARYDEIVDFSGIGDFIDQPVKTYSSGMYVRLAFSVATSIDPDILVIDEALSVGDGEFARRSFDRIMGLRDKGATILFCSHSMYHIEAICNRACWLDRGQLQLLGDPAQVVTAFDAHLSRPAGSAFEQNISVTPDSQKNEAVCPPQTARISGIYATAGGLTDRQLKLQSQESDLSIRVDFISDIELPPPSVAIGIHTKDGHSVSSAGSLYDNAFFQRDSRGNGSAEIIFPRIPLLKGDYTVSVFLTCERLIHIYDHAERYIELTVSQRGLEQGVVALPHIWRDGSGSEEGSV